MLNKSAVTTLKSYALELIIPSSWTDWIYNTLADDFPFGDIENTVHVLVNPRMLNEYLQDVLQGEELVDSEDLHNVGEILYELDNNSVLVSLQP